MPIVYASLYAQRLLPQRHDPALRACEGSCQSKVLLHGDGDHDQRHVLCVVVVRSLCVTSPRHRLKVNLGTLIVRMGSARSAVASRANVNRLRPLSCVAQCEFVLQSNVR